MKRILAIFLLFCFQLSLALEQDIKVYNKNNKFGLSDSKQTITEAKYSKLIRLKDESWLCLYKKRYGIIDNTGKILVPIEYSQAERLVGRFAKLGKSGKFGIFNEKAINIIPVEYSKIELLYGRMFLVEKNHKYGLISFDGNIILPPTVDDIYMPKPNIMKILHKGIWYEIEQKNRNEIELPQDIKDIVLDNDFKITKIVNKPIQSVGYGVISVGDYFIKMFSSISPSYEQTIDELVLNHGADTAGILLNPSWFIKFPFVYVKNYFQNIKSPNNGPFSDVKENLRDEINK